MDSVSWTSMAEGTAADYRALSETYESHARGTLVSNLVTLLGQLKGPKLGYQIDRYQHSLQSASRAMRNNESVDLVVGALLHDVGDVFAPANHSAAAATIIEPFVDAETHWVIKHHGLFQGYYYFHHLGGDRNARDAYRQSPHFDACVRFCHAYDQNCFAPDYQNLAIEDFVPALDEVFARQSQLPNYAAAPVSDRIV